VRGNEYIAERQSWYQRGSAEPREVDVEAAGGYTEETKSYAEPKEATV